jgi:hypothetical protein
MVSRSGMVPAIDVEGRDGRVLRLTRMRES